MTTRLPKLYDLILNHKGTLGIITGFRICSRPDLGTSIQVNGQDQNFCEEEQEFKGEGFLWSGTADTANGALYQNHLFLNNKGIWECVSRPGDCPLYEEWLKQNERCLLCQKP